MNCPTWQRNDNKYHAYSSISMVLHRTSNIAKRFWTSSFSYPEPFKFCAQREQQISRKPLKCLGTREDHFSSNAKHGAEITTIKNHPLCFIQLCTRLKLKKLSLPANNFSVGCDHAKYHWISLLFWCSGGVIFESVFSLQFIRNHSTKTKQSSRTFLIEV